MVAVPSLWPEVSSLVAMEAMSKGNADQPPALCSSSNVI